MDAQGESPRSQFVHVILPTIIVLIIAGSSFTVDFYNIDNEFWFQRSGALIVAVSVYIAFHENSNKIKKIGVSLKISLRIWYQWLALFLGILGTLIWAYGDLPFKNN